MRKTGTVKWFDSARGFGFINRDDGRTPLLVHETGIRADGEGGGTLKKGDRVEFAIISDSDGPEAEDVVVIEYTDATVQDGGGDGGGRRRRERERGFVRAHAARRATPRSCSV